jgi:molybdopterin/thiamine biosynthesis adenylyltransferase
MDKDYLLPRGGASANLFEKNVLLVGCGSIGSCIAQNLSKSGIGKMTLIDNDVLKPENVHRHLLGMKNCLKTRAKSDLLKAQLESELPHCEIESICENFQSVLKNGFDFSPFDLVILATGNDNLSILTSEFFHENFSKKPVIFTWLDPLGIGGHALLTNLEPHGCYKCLFEKDLHNKASFAEKGQSFSKTMAGCSGRFTDFGFLDVQETALLAVRLSLEVLKNEKASNQLISWIGNDEKFISEGFKTATRYQKNAEKNRLVKLDFADECCPICGDSARRHRIPTLKIGDVDNH